MLVGFLLFPGLTCGKQFQVKNIHDWEISVLTIYYTVAFLLYLVLMLMLSLLCENVSLSKCLISVNDLCLQDIINIDKITLWK